MPFVLLEGFFFLKRYTWILLLMFSNQCTLLLFAFYFLLFVPSNAFIFSSFHLNHFSHYSDFAYLKHLDFLMCCSNKVVSTSKINKRRQSGTLKLWWQLQSHINITHIDWSSKVYYSLNAFKYTLFRVNKKKRSMKFKFMGGCVTATEINPHQIHVKKQSCVFQPVFIPTGTTSPKLPFLLCHCS